MNLEGKIIAIEGIDGSGKTTQSSMLNKMLSNKGYSVVQSHEPTNGQWGLKLRESATTGRLSIEDEIEYFLNDRKEHVENLILPTISQNGVVILDRYYFSNMAYQSARGANPQAIREKNELFAPIPDYLFILDLDVDDALARILSRGDIANEFEQRESLQYCRNMFLSLKEEPFAHVISADQSIDAVHADIIQTITGVSN